MMWVAYSIVWLSMAAAVSTGIYVTGKWSLLWFMVIPLFVSMSSDNKKDDGKQSGEYGTAEKD